MRINEILNHSGYNLRSISRLAARDDTWARLWMHRLDPLYGVYHQLRNQRVAVRKEFYETAFVLDRLRPELKTTTALWELGAGHGMLGMFACVLHRGLGQAVLLDRRAPPSYGKIRELLAREYPFVKTRTRFIEGEIDGAVGIPAGALVVGVHACGVLTDLLVETAHHAGADFAVVPCCESRKQLPAHLRKTLPKGQTEAAVTARRLSRWRKMGYDIEERSIPFEVTPRGRLFVGRLSPSARGLESPDAL